MTPQYGRLAQLEEQPARRKFSCFTRQAAMSGFESRSVHHILKQKGIVVMKKIICILLIVCVVCGVLSGCRQATRVSHNISKQADQFNVVRRLTVINARSDKVMLEMTGTFSLKNNTDGELEVTCQTGPNEYRKHFVYINKEWTMYTVVDVSGSNVSPYRFEVNFLPEMIVPIEFGDGHSWGWQAVDSGE